MRVLPSITPLLCFSVIPHIEILEDFIFSDLKKIKAVLISTYLNLIINIYLN